MIIDYDDMVAQGIIKEASDFLPDNASASYAIMLNTPAGYVGKFRVTTPQDISNSVEAINKNAALADYIKKPAMYFIKRAADTNNIETGWGDIPDKRYSRYIDYRDPAADPAPFYVMKTAGQRDIEIHNERDYQSAVDMFKTANYAFTGNDRIRIAADLLKTAIMLKVACDPYVNAYAYANYSARTADILETRKALTNNADSKAKYDIVKEAYLKLGNDLPPDVFITAVEGIDKEAGVVRDVVQFFQ